MDEPLTSITVTLGNLHVLHVAYMPFLKNGGLFIPTSQKGKIGDKLTIHLNLLKEPSVSFTASVVWITPEGSQGNRVPGFGVAFEDDIAEAMREKIETALLGKIESDWETDTL